MRLKLDENLSRHLKRALAVAQHDITTAVEEGLLSKPDYVIAEAAKKEGRVLLTLDVEFGDLRKYPPGSHPGIILFRPPSRGPVTINRYIEDFIRSTYLDPLHGCVVVVEPSRVRVRFPGPGSSAREGGKSES